jgi:DNA transformation protein and related proteins
MDRERIEELFAPFGPVAVKRLFGGLGIYADGAHIAIEHKGEIFLKADAVTQSLFEAAGSRQFVYSTPKRTIALSYWKLVDNAFEDEEELRRWANLALAAARRSLENQPKKRGTKRSRATKEAIPRKG